MQEQTTKQKWMNRLVPISIVVIGSLLIGYTVWEIVEDRRQIAAGKAEFQDIMQRTRDLPDLVNKVADSRETLNDIKNQIWEPNQTDDLLRELNAQLERARVENWDINLLPSKSDGKFAIHPIKITFDGSSMATFRFLNLIEEMPRLVEVTQLELEKSSTTKAEKEGGNTNVKVALILNTYFFQPAERAS